MYYVCKGSESRYGRDRDKDGDRDTSGYGTGVSRGRDGKVAGDGRQTLRLYKVVALRAHNTKKGRRKAPERVIYVMERDALRARDVVERGYRDGKDGRGGRNGRVPGIKAVVSVEPVDIREMFCALQARYIFLE